MTNPEKQPEEMAETAIPEEVKKQAEAVAPVNPTEELQAKVEEFKNAAMRALADAENTRKRAAKEVEEANRYGVSTFAKDLISVLENLQRALDTVTEEQKQDKTVSGIFEGVDLTRKELLSVFERRGIKRLEPKPGEKFDHNFHQAVAQVEDFKFEAGSVIQSVQAGYVIHDRLLRPAMVTVSKGAPQHVKVDTTA